MNTKHLSMIAAVSFLSVAGLARADAPPSAEAREKAAVLKVEQLVANATTPEAGLSTFSPDIVQDDFFPPQRHGIPEVAQDFKVYMDNYGSFNADILDMNIQVQGSLAVAISHQHFTAKGKNGSPDLDAVVRQTDVLRKKNGKWLITYQHLSVPIDLKTDKAILKP
jgi:ketosteroid isomerase-like protein